MSQQTLILFFELWFGVRDFPWTEGLRRREDMYRIKRALTSVAVTTMTVSAIAMGSPLISSAAADPSAATSAQAVALGVTPTPDPVALMGEFNSYWKPLSYDKTNSTTKSETAFRGTVLDPAVLDTNDKLVVAINNAGAADLDQQRRALVDADYVWQETYADALGPVLSKYLDDGLSSNALPNTKAAIDTAGNLGTGAAKPTFNYPRPWITDRSFTGQANPSTLNGLQTHLNIAEIPDWTDASGTKHSAGYDSLLSGYSQAFPSGHTTYAYSTGIALAQLIPQLGPEIVTRASEAANNRIVLGVHYPLDIMGGRIIGEANNSSLWSDSSTFSSVLQPAENEVQSYLAGRCKADGLGSTLEECIKNTGANADAGYRNFFTDAVSTSPVTDRTSALAAYQARMTYGFTQTSQAGQAAVVPTGAESLLATTFPSLTASQRRAVLAATEIDSGYPLDSSSNGWQRLDLAAAMSSKVTLDATGNVTKVEPGQAVASVVDPTAPTSSAPSSSETASSSPASSDTTSSAPSSTESSTSATSTSAPSSPAASSSASVSTAPTSTSSTSAAVRPVSTPAAPSTKAATVLGLPLTGASGAEGLIGLAAVLSAAVGGLFAARKMRH